VTTLLLIHGGLWEDGMDAESFWHKPGIVAGLQRHGFEVLTPNRRYRAPDWTAEVNHLAPVLPDRPVTILAGSNGCSVIEGLLLAWPATANDPTVDAQSRAGLTELDVSPEIVDALLTGQTLRGVTDGELATLRIPVGMLPSVPRILSTRGTPSTHCAASCHEPTSCPAAPSLPIPAFHHTRSRS
jgi:hypothetical protein